MTRKEQIKEVAQKEMSKYPNFCITAPAFRMGAEWADANPNKDNMATAYKAGEAATIDKACEWLKEYIEWNDLCTLEDIEQFRKAMKGD